MKRALEILAISVSLAITLILFQCIFDEGTPDASTLSVPYTFSSGTPAYASQVNDNFTAVESVVNALDDANYSNDGMTASTKLVDASVSLAKMGSASVDSDNIVDGTIVAADFSGGGISSADIIDGTIALIDMASASVDSDNIVDGTIVEADFASTAMVGSLTHYVSGAPSTSNDTYSDLIEGSISTTEGNNDHYVALGDMVFTGLSVELATAPGSGNTWLITLRDDGANTSASCTIADTASACTWTGSTSVIASGSKLSLAFTPLSGPTVTADAWVNYFFVMQ